MGCSGDTMHEDLVFSYDSRVGLNLEIKMVKGLRKGRDIIHMHVGHVVALKSLVCGKRRGCKTLGF